MRTMKKIILISLGIVILAGGVFGYFTFIKPDKVEAPTKQVEDIKQETEKTPEVPAFNKQRYSTEDPNSLWVVVNKKRPLQASFEPQEMTNTSGGFMKREASEALESLFEEAQNQTLPLQVLSAYRSYNSQSATYNSYVQKDGVEKADTYSARPGFSEHQTGLAVDVGSGSCNLEICFGETPAGKWLAANAHTYGFVIRYPQGKTAITGYQYEPWHLRYVGKELAAELHTSGQTMEEFFGLPLAPGY